MHPMFYDLFLISCGGIYGSQTWVHGDSHRSGPLGLSMFLGILLF